LEVDVLVYAETVVEKLMWRIRETEDKKANFSELKEGTLERRVYIEVKLTVNKLI